MPWRGEPFACRGEGTGGALSGESLLQQRGRRWGARAGGGGREGPESGVTPQMCSLAPWKLVPFTEMGGGEGKINLGLTCFYVWGAISFSLSWRRRGSRGDA